MIYVIWYFLNYSLKIKINDKAEFLEKLITCNFAYNKTDERYWYVDPQFLVDEISKKTKVHGMWKISILNKETRSDLTRLLLPLDHYCKTGIYRGLNNEYLVLPHNKYRINNLFIRKQISLIKWFRRSMIYLPYEITFIITSYL